MLSSWDLQHPARPPCSQRQVSESGASTDQQLTQDENPATHTSLVSSVTTVALPSADGATKTVTLVDVPGHARLRDQVSKLLPDSTAVVFVVDIVNLVRNASSVAE